MRSLRSSASRIIAASKPTPAMTPKRSPANRPTSKRRRSPPQPDRDRLLDVRRDAQVRREEVRGAGGDDREARVPARELADAAADGAVAAPGEHEVGALVEGAAHLRGRLLGLRHLVPERVRVPAVGEDAAQLRQTAAERLLGVGDDRDPHDAAGTLRRDGDLARAGAALAGGRALGGARGPAREQEHHHRADADEERRPRRRAGGACRGTSATIATKIGTTIATAQAAIRTPRLPTPETSRNTRPA